MSFCTILILLSSKEDGDQEEENKENENDDDEDENGEKRETVSGPWNKSSSQPQTQTGECVDNWEKSKILSEFRC